VYASCSNRVCFPFSQEYRFLFQFSSLFTGFNQRQSIVFARCPQLSRFFLFFFTACTANGLLLVLARRPLPWQRVMYLLSSLRQGRVPRFHYRVAGYIFLPPAVPFRSPLLRGSLRHVCPFSYPCSSFYTCFFTLLDDVFCPTFFFSFGLWNP